MEAETLPLVPQQGETRTHSSRVHLLRKSREGSLVIYAALVQRQGTAGPCQRCGHRGGFGDVGSAGPGWDWALLNLWWPRDKPMARGGAGASCRRRGGQSSCCPQGQHTIPFWDSHPRLAGQRKRLFAPSPCPTAAATGSACQQTLCGARIN